MTHKKNQNHHQFFASLRILIFLRNELQSETFLRRRLRVVLDRGTELEGRVKVIAKEMTVL
jgi:hypothetical protein